MKPRTRETMKVLSDRVWVNDELDASTGMAGSRRSRVSPSDPSGLCWAEAYGDSDDNGDRHRHKFQVRSCKWKVSVFSDGMTFNQ